MTMGSSARSRCRWARPPIRPLVEPAPNDQEVVAERRRRREERRQRRRDQGKAPTHLGEATPPRPGDTQEDTQGDSLWDTERKAAGSHTDEEEAHDGIARHEEAR